MANTREDVFKFVTMGADDDCWPWTGATGGRARALRPYFQCEGKRYIAYRLIYELVHGVVLEPKQLLLHSCDNGNMPVGCCNPKHLSIGDVQANSNDMKERERHGLTHHMVKSIRKMLADGHTHQHIASMSGVSRETISAINNKRVYAHVLDDAVIDAEDKHDGTRQD